MQAISNIFGDNRILTIFGLVAAVLVALIILVYAVRFIVGRKGRLATARGRQPRLAVVDAFDIDKQRQLVLIRRDNVEHLIMIGGPNDVVVESTIQRYQRAEDAPANSRGPVVGQALASAAGDVLRPIETPRQYDPAPKAAAADSQPVLPALPPTMVAPQIPTPQAPAQQTPVHQAPAPQMPAPSLTTRPEPQRRPMTAPAPAVPAPVRSNPQASPPAATVPTPAVKAPGMIDPRSAFMPNAKTAAQIPPPPVPGQPGNVQPTLPTPRTPPGGPGAPPVMMPMRGPAAMAGRSDAPQAPGGAPAVRPPKPPQSIQPDKAKPAPSMPLPASEAPPTTPDDFDPLGSLEDDLAKLLGRAKS